MAAFDACVQRVAGFGIDGLPARGLGLVPIAEAASFGWGGFWIARDADGRCAVMFGAPSAPVDGGTIEVVAGWAVAPFDPTEARAPVDAGVGVVEAILVAGDVTGPMHAVDAAEATVDGLVGDRYATGEGTFSGPGTTGTALTLVETEALQAAGVTREEARRNVVVRAVGLDGLIGRRFAIGDVECLGLRRCEPCAHLERLTRPGVLRALVHRGGLRADVIAPGTLRLGDAVRAL